VGLAPSGSKDANNCGDGHVGSRSASAEARATQISASETIGPCTGAGPRTRRTELTEHRNPLRNRLSAAACIRVIEY
jgi:hypothetical protein